MAEKIKIYPKTLADGGLEFEISIEDQSLLGKKPLFQLNEKFL
ncbi:hypothetical protein [Candidatus Seribacter sulfatis]